MRRLLIGCLPAGGVVEGVSSRGEVPTVARLGRHGSAGVQLKVHDSVPSSMSRKGVEQMEMMSGDSRQPPEHLEDLSDAGET